jgi:hypothetical protein
MDYHPAQPTMKMVFQLATQMESNPREVERIQQLTLDSSSSLGLKGACGLYGTPRWWGSIQDGSIKTRRCTGIIYRAYLADGSNDFNDLMMDVFADGLMVAESCYSLSADGYHLFRSGHRVEFRCAYDELKAPRQDGQPAYSQCMLEMSVSDEPWPGAESIVGNIELSKIQRTFLLNP